MRRGSHDYLFLFSSLPPLGSLLDGKPLPISRLQLDRRMALLAERDRTRMRQVDEIVHWRGSVLEQPDEVIVERMRRRIAAIRDPELQHLLLARLEVRTVIKAIRLRAAGADAPAGDWGPGRWVRHIATHWQVPDFALGHVYPWITRFQELHAERDASELERFILGLLWHQLDGFAVGHHFDFLAVLIYVMRWNLKARVAGYDADGAVAVFERLVAEAERGPAEGAAA